jgi:hypothetical protein
LIRTEYFYVIFHFFDTNKSQFKFQNNLLNKMSSNADVPNWPAKSEIDEIAEVHEISEAREQDIKEHQPHHHYDDSKLLVALSHELAHDKHVESNEILEIAAVHQHSEERRSKLAAEEAAIDPAHDNDTKLLNALIHEVSVDGPNSEIEQIAKVHDESEHKRHHDTASV